MILVTGTKRSGTSMWMQALVAAGLPHIGEKFPRDWGEIFREANPGGFYESELMVGIYWETNPHPRTGDYLFPEHTRAHAVKVFIPGLVRTDVAFIDRCLASVRPWRAYVRSVTRMHALMDPRGATVPRLPPALEWWAENHALVRDIATRRYPAHVVAYDAVRADPARHVREVLGWIGAGDPGAGLAAIAHGQVPAEQDETDPPLPDGLAASHVEVFDGFYDAVAREHPLDDALIDAMNRVHQELQPVLLEHTRALHEQAVGQWLPRG